MQSRVRSRAKVTRGKRAEEKVRRVVERVKTTRARKAGRTKAAKDRANMVEKEKARGTTVGGVSLNPA